MQLIMLTWVLRDHKQNFNLIGFFIDFGSKIISVCVAIAGPHSLPRPHVFKMLTRLLEATCQISAFLVEEFARHTKIHIYMQTNIPMNQSIPHLLLKEKKDFTILSLVLIKCLSISLGINLLDW